MAAQPREGPAAASAPATAPTKPGPVVARAFTWTSASQPPGGRAGAEGTVPGLRSWARVACVPGWGGREGGDSPERRKGFGSASPERRCFAGNTIASPGECSGVAISHRESPSGEPGGTRLMRRCPQGEGLGPTTATEDGAGWWERSSDRQRGERLGDPWAPGCCAPGLLEESASCRGIAPAGAAAPRALRTPRAPFKPRSPQLEKRKAQSSADSSGSPGQQRTV